MCGRYTLTADMSDLERLDWYDELLLDHQPRYNIAPTQDAPNIRVAEDDVRVLEGFRWGLVPFWAKDPKIGYRLINARSETADTKPSPVRPAGSFGAMSSRGRRRGRHRG